MRAGSVRSARADRRSRRKPGWTDRRGPNAADVDPIPGDSKGVSGACVRPLIPSRCWLRGPALDGPLTKWWWRLASGDGPVTRATKPYGTRGERTRGHRVQPPRTHWGHECAARTQRIDGWSLDRPSTSGREGQITCRAPPYPRRGSLNPWRGILQALDRTQHAGSARSWYRPGFTRQRCR